MKKCFRIALPCCSCMLFLAAGCAPELAQVPVGEEEKEWNKVLKDNYYSFTPPHTPAPASYQFRASAPARSIPEDQLTPAAAADDPVAAVDRAAAKENQAAPAAEIKTADEVKPASSVIPVAEKKTVTAPAAKAKQEIAPASAATKTADGEYGKPYIVERGDTLGKIALRFYGKASMEEVIFNANSKVITDRNKLRPGMKLVIPEL